MNLGELILALKPLLEDPTLNADKVIDLLERHQSLAEFEVARFYVSQTFSPELERRLRSIDPKDRLAAVRGVPNVLGLAGASRILRRGVKDADSVVRGAARAAIQKLGLTDVAPPDTRYERPRSKRLMVPGGWNPSGWAFGMYKGESRSAQLKRVGTGKLPKLPLPAIPDMKALFELLQITRFELSTLLRPGEGSGSPYVQFEIAKATGGKRVICAPRKKLKQVQRIILDKILSKMPVSDACHGFVPKRSIRTNAEPHLRSAVVMKFDLVDFFPTIHYRRIVGLFAHYGYHAQVGRTLAALVTHRPKLADGTPIWPGILPQGAPTSPALANLVCRRLDARLSALAKQLGGRYTRYADDLTFSFPEKTDVRVGRFLWWVDAICHAEGFVENTRKRRVLRPHVQQRVTGVVVNDKLTIPRERRRAFRAALARCKKDGFAATLAANPKLREEMAGFAAYVKMVQPELGESFAQQVRALHPPHAGSDEEAGR